MRSRRVLGMLIQLAEVFATLEDIHGHRKHVLAAPETVIGAIPCSVMSGSRPVGSTEIGRICASVCLEPTLCCLQR
eukprot:SAG22_NODE_371_length_11566_cov_5.447458_5_plen_76_part_00